MLKSKLYQVEEKCGGTPDLLSWKIRCAATNQTLQFSETSILTFSTPFSSTFQSILIKHPKFTVYLQKYQPNGEDGERRRRQQPTGHFHQELRRRIRQNDEHPGHGSSLRAQRKEPTVRCDHRARGWYSFSCAQGDSLRLQHLLQVRWVEFLRLFIK